jgi:SAM-dependent methyltransferase
VGEIFERVIPETPLEWTGERLTTATEGQVEVEHLHRYFLARALCRGLDVLDVAAGEGYGSALLAQVARSVIGVEISTEAVAHAIAAYRGANLKFLKGDARCLPLDDASVDAVVSFETIEHFFEHDQFLAEVRRVLRPGGRFIVSSPERDVYSPSGSSANPYHVKELSREEFSALLRNSFAHVRLLGQRPMLGSALMSEGDGPGQSLTFEKRGPRHFEAAGGLPRPVYWVGVASDQPVADVPDSLYIDTAEIGAVLAAACAAEAEHAALRAQAAAAQADAESARRSLEAERARSLEAERARSLEAERVQSLEAASLRQELARRVEEAQLRHAELRHCKADLAVKQAFIDDLRHAVQQSHTEANQLRLEASQLRIAVNSAGFRLLSGLTVRLRRTPALHALVQRTVRALVRLRDRWSAGRVHP